MGDKRALFAGPLLVLVGCTDGVLPVAATLTDGTTVSVDEEGSITIARERELLRLPRGPEAAAFVTRDESLLGSYRFSREGEVRVSFSEYLFSEVTAEGVSVHYAAGVDEAVVRIAADDGDVSIRVETAVAHDAMELAISCDAASTFYGWGEQFNRSDQRGQAFDLFVQEQGIGRTGDPEVLTPLGHEHTTFFPMPYYLDARGHGVLVETDYRTVVDLCQADPSVATIEVEGSEPFSARLFTGPTTADVIERLGARVGRPAAPPPWAYRLWIGSQGGDAAVRAEVDALEAAGVPVGVFWVQDWSGQRDNLGGGSGVSYRWVDDPDLYPNLAGLVNELHSRGYRFLAYANPFVMQNLDDHYPEMRDQGWLIGDGEGGVRLEASPAGDAGQPDVTNPAARAYVKSFLTRKVEELGIDGWMADFGEWAPLDGVYADGSDPRAMHNRYPEGWHRLSREVMDESRPDGDWVVFTRSGWTGDQAVAQVVWCGDQEATFEEGDGLPTVIACMINLGLSGVPFVTHDIAGFSGGPSTKELYLRWIELGAFSPIMRTHEGNLKDANWSWEKDQETTDALRRFATIHDALAPELQTWAAEAAATSMPIVRHLMLSFPGDVESLSVDDAYMLGPELLVAPVVEEGATSREVYLPPGTWFHLWTGESFQGPATIEIEAPLGAPPVFSLGRDRQDLRAVQ